MNALGGYVLRLCCCAIIAGCVMSIGGSGTGSRARNMICGLFVLFAAISALREVEIGEFLDLPENLYQEGTQISSAAQRDAGEAIQEGIIRQTQAYILDEAASLNAQLQVTQIRLDPDTLVPVCVTLEGEISPYRRSVLTSQISRNLGMEKEGVVWMD